MQFDTQAAPSRRIYRERLTPSLWILGAAAVVGPMAALTLTPIDQTLALFAGVAAVVLLLWALIALSPVIEVSAGELRVGRAHIPVSLLADPRPLTGDEARRARGAGLNPRAWYRIRAGIDGLVVVENTDAADPVPEWVVSTRTPDRLAAAIAVAQKSA